MSLAATVGPRTASAPAWVALLIGAAWLTAVAAEVTGGSALLHHHSLVDGGFSIGGSLALFVGGWLVMIAAMMLPASLPVIGQTSVAAFIGAFAVIWLVVGLTFLGGDVVVHRLVDATPWFADRSWLLEAGVLAFAGTYQFLPIKRRFMDACRAPRGSGHGERSGLAAGMAHALDCVGSSGPMMLLMFATGVANVAWMLGLTVVMALEASQRHGDRAAAVAGAALLVLALLTLTHAGLPAWAAPA